MYRCHDAGAVCRHCFWDEIRDSKGCGGLYIRNAAFSEVRGRMDADSAGRQRNRRRRNDLSGRKIPDQRNAGGRTDLCGYGRRRESGAVSGRGTDQQFCRSSSLHKKCRGDDDPVGGGNRKHSSKRFGNRCGEYREYRKCCRCRKYGKHRKCCRYGKYGKHRKCCRYGKYRKRRRGSAGKSGCLCQG